MSTTASEGGRETSEQAPGTDIVYSSASFSLSGQQVENLTPLGSGNINATGNSPANILTGNDGNNVLDGRGGADTMTGGKGDDTYFVDNVNDVVTEAHNEGTDSASSSIDYTLTPNVENLTSDRSALNGTGNGLNNSLTGTDGDNALDGKAGIDTMTGGKGNDTYYVDNSSDDVIESSGSGSGTDIVYSSASFNLAGQQVENLTLMAGFGNINATGNSLVNLLTGNEGNNVLDGKAGADTMIGGKGNDTYYVTTAATSTEAGNEGTDSVISSVDYTLASNVENLTLTGSALNATGNASANSPTGNDLANVLDGKGGIDTKTGGKGNDTYYVDNSSDAGRRDLRHRLRHRHGLQLGELQPQWPADRELHPHGQFRQHHRHGQLAGQCPDRQRGE